jgi:hypothetical protein
MVGARVLQVLMSRDCMRILNLTPRQRSSRERKVAKEREKISKAKEREKMAKDSPRAVAVKGLKSC